MAILRRSLVGGLILGACVLVFAEPALAKGPRHPGRRARGTQNGQRSQNAQNGAGLPNANQAQPAVSSGGSTASGSGKTITRGYHYLTANGKTYTHNGTTTVTKGANGSETIVHDGTTTLPNGKTRTHDETTTITKGSNGSETITRDGTTTSANGKTRTNDGTTTITKGAGGNETITRDNTTTFANGKTRDPRWDDDHHQGRQWQRNDHARWHDHRCQRQDADERQHHDDYQGDDQPGNWHAGYWHAGNWHAGDGRQLTRFDLARRALNWPPPGLN